MSLQWDLSNIENYEALCWLENTSEDKKDDEAFILNPVTEAIIHLCEFAGVSRITSNNYKETVKRFAELELFGLKSFDTGNPREADVKEHIGLMTNADVLDNKKWGNKIRNLVREYAEQLIDNNYSKNTV